MLVEVGEYYCYLNNMKHCNSDGRTLAGFCDTTMKVFLPTLRYLNYKHDEDKALNFGNSLLLGGGIDELNEPSLIKFKKVMISSRI